MYAVPSAEKVAGGKVMSASKSDSGDSSELSEDKLGSEESFEEVVDIVGEGGVLIASSGVCFAFFIRTDLDKRDSTSGKVVSTKEAVLFPVEGESLACLISPSNENSALVSPFRLLGSRHRPP